MNEVQTTLYCTNHPQIETALRCNRCEKPICVKCAVLTPTGYRCKDCVRGQQKIFETAQWFDYPLAIVLTAALSFLGSLLIPYIGFFTIFIAPLAGTVIGEVARIVVRRRRSKRLFQLTAAAAAIGSLPTLLILGVGMLGGGSGFRFLLPLVWQAIYTFTVASTIYYRLGGIRFR